MTTGGQASRLSTLVVTNLTKLAGVAIALRAGFIGEPDSRVIALALFMVAGGQFSETVLLAAIDRLFGRTPPKE
jgi:hypothetical protein